MHKFLRQRYTEKTALFGALGLLNAPLAFLPAALGGLVRLYEFRRSHDDKVEEIAELEHYTELPKDAALSVLCRDMGDQAGIGIRHVFMKGASGPFRNAMVISERKSETSIFFEGNPMTDPVLQNSGQGEAILRGVVGHELGHTLSSGDNSFQANTIFTTILYGLGGGLSTLGAIFSVGSGAFVAGAILMGTSLAGFAGAFVTKALQHRFWRNEEYLADFQGARLFGADHAVIAHDYNRKCLRQPKKPDPVTPPAPPTRMDRFMDLCEKFYGETHPSADQRIAALRDVFNSTAEYKGAAAKDTFPEDYLKNLNELIAQQQTPR